jgi:hypothetical protein
MNALATQGLRVGTFQVHFMYQLPALTRDEPLELQTS